MAAKFSDLVEYFEKLAGEHVSIAHTATNKHFYRFELDEVLTGMCTSIKYPALILEGYDFNFSESSSDNIRKKRSGAFILIDKITDLKDYNKIHEVWDELELIGDDILVRLRADKESRLVPVLRDFNINECTGTLLSVLELGQHGIRFTFNLTSPVNSEVDETRWQ
jgi:hypothetical protein